jgi:hypothetical protein
MSIQKLMLFIVLPVLLVTLVSGTCLAQGPVKTPAAKPAKPETETLKGTIDYMERLGGYFIRGVEPGGEFFIVNQNPTVLKKLKESGKTVTIQGYTTKTGAEYFFIEKIDGKKYSAAKPAAKKATSK